jgi:glucokinase
MPEGEGLIIGVDIGGTKVAAGLVNPRGEILFKSRIPMVSRKSAAAGLHAVVIAIETVLAAEAAQGACLSAIGISCPGPLDPTRGVVINPPNLPCWRNFPIADKIQEACGLSAQLDNDANAAALAESLWGAGAGYPSVFYTTLGTGIGTGIVLDGCIYHGRTGAAGEGGHVSVDPGGPLCGCGKRGCIEALASGPALAGRARAKVVHHRGGSLAILTLAGGNPEGITAEVVGEATRMGDKLASEVLRETADYLAIWLGTIIDLLEPAVIIVGGGLGELMEFWFEHIRSQLSSWSINSRCQEIPLVRAHYAEDSGIAGAAALCLQARHS